MTTVLSGLGKRLVDRGIITEDRLKDAQQTAARDKTPLVAYLVQNSLADARSLATMSSEEFGIPMLDLAAFDRELLPKDLVETKLIQHHRALPLFKRGNRLYVALSDPTNLAALDEMRFATGLTTEPVLVEEDKLAVMLEEAADEGPSALEGLDDGDFEELDVVDEAQEQEERTDISGSDDAPIVRFVQQMLLSAIKKGASDLHFEPYERSYRVRIRIDGVLQTAAKPPIQLAPKITARLKILGNLDISERRVPQDGRIKLRISRNKAIDFRMNTLPTLFGEKVVLRILDPSSAKLGIDALGYEPDQKQHYMTALSKPQGMILVTGPTGSGKTVSLYTGINIVNQEGVNISTAEDPVEINLEGINQVNVNAKVGLDFASALRSFLRQDPDVIMVGEIRDLETAAIAIKAAQTGHMVMSTLHTNSAAETLTRLLNMGVPSFNLATTINVIIAQRLARRLCSQCKKPAEIPEDTLRREGFDDDLLAEATLYQPVGCSACNKGYKGRVGVYEVVRITPAISRIIMEEGNSIQLDEQFRKEGFNDLRRSGLLKAAQGVTSLEEINRVTSEH
ncbi:MAG: type IV-A pilus assembly ATPase PilB [Natronospirillum sp.]|uniref:type IV-A pilus assembly ATPase PilB n=1 Tax=Natronospirillum sp. TaxID=2812955 RepID=UPI0025DA2441|nr:type IV-A pilus assembly ATPase PilB [Natronospirillum sp.]MCH8551350.1 type IV-A pilus assembly ATPase PilB [Natronospirillum sp.]